MTTTSTLKWPHGKKFAVCLTHDVDRVNKTYQYFTKFVRLLSHFQVMDAINELKNIHKPFFIDNIENDPYWGFERIIEIENKHKVKSTFYFLNETGKFEIFRPSTWKLYLGRYNIKNPEIIKIIRKLYSGGWDIGLHGSYNSYINKNLLKKEKEELEFILGEKIYGIRQHYLNLEIPSTWIIQKEIGIKYDSSFSYRNQIGFGESYYYPFYPLGDSSFLVIPLSLMDSDLISSDIDINDVWHECVEKIETVEKVGGLLTINWHQERCNDFEFFNNFMIYEKILKLCLEKDAWVANSYEVYKWVTLSKDITR